MNDVTDLPGLNVTSLAPLYITVNDSVGNITVSNCTICACLAVSMMAHFCVNACHMQCYLCCDLTSHGPMVLMVSALWFLALCCSCIHQQACQLQHHVLMCGTQNCNSLSEALLTITFMGDVCLRGNVTYSEIAVEHTAKQAVVTCST